MHYSMYQNNEMIGIGSVFNAKEAGAFTVADALNIFRFYGLKSFAAIKSGLKVEKLIKLPENHEIAIGHLGIKPALRGQGLGTKMIELLMEEANKTKDSYWILDVSEENPKAKALYERLGFKTTQKHISNLKNQYSYVANHFRMELGGDSKLSS